MTTTDYFGRELHVKRTLLGLLVLGIVSCWVVADADAATRGLVAYYRFDGGANADDLSGNGHDGEVLGTAELLDDENAPVPGDKGCLLVDFARGSGVVCGNGAEFRQASNFSVLAWAYPMDTIATQYVAGVPASDQLGWNNS